MTYYLSPHFTLGEMLKSDTAQEQGIINAPNWDALREMVLLANNTLEPIRALLMGRAMIISSGFRCQELNEAVGGSETSAHMSGAAADFTVQGLSVKQVYDIVGPHAASFEIDQLINEYGSWIHVGRAPMGQIPRNDCFVVT